MPIYCYEREDGTGIEEVHMSMFEPHPETITCKDGVLAHRSLAEEQRSRRVTSCALWPLESDSMGVHPSQVQEAQAMSEKLGVPTEFNRRTGAAIFRTAEHRKEYCEAHGYYDRNGGYSDPQKHTHRRRGE